MRWRRDERGRGGQDDGRGHGRHDGRRADAGARPRGADADRPQQGHALHRGVRAAGAAVQRALVDRQHGPEGHGAHRRLGAAAVRDRLLLLFAVYSALVGVYAARREELVLKRLRTGELRDGEILAGAAVPSVSIGLAQSLVLVAACTAFLDVGAPQAPYYAVLGLLLGLVMWPALAAVTASFSRSVESAQVAAMPLLLLSMLGSGTVVPLQVMPDRLASVCELLPLTPVITLVRGGWTGDLSAHGALGAVATAVAWTVLAVFAVRRWFRWEPRR